VAASQQQKCCARTSSCSIFCGSLICDRGVDAGGLGGLAGGASRVVDNAAAGRGDVDVGADATRSSLELLSLRQVPPWLLWVKVFWHLLTGMVLSVFWMLVRVSVTELLSSPVTSVWCPASSLMVLAVSSSALWPQKGVAALRPSKLLG